MKTRPILSFLLDQRGTATVEYVVLLVCVAVAFSAAWGVFGRQIVAIIAGD